MAQPAKRDAITERECTTWKPGDGVPAVPAAIDHLKPQMQIAADEDACAPRKITGAVHHQTVTDEQARVLARDGNVAVTQLAGRAFPGIHIQGDTFAELRQQFADAVGQVRHFRADNGAWDELDAAVGELTQMLRFYESVLDEHDVQRPYSGGNAG